MELQGSFAWSSAAAAVLAAQLAMAPPANAEITLSYDVIAAAANDTGNYGAYSKSYNAETARADLTGDVAQSFLSTLPFLGPTPTSPVTGRTTRRPSTPPHRSTTG